MIKKLILSALLIAGITHAATGDDVRSFELDGSTRYVGGRFEMETEGRILFTTPTPPTRSRSQGVTVYGDTPSSSEESFLIRNGDQREDKRIRIENTEKFPWSIHAQMTMEFESSPAHAGSGVLVGPHHILTAAHNVYNSGNREFARSIKVRVGLNGESAIFGEISGVKLYLYDQWQTSRSKEFDIALVILNQSIGYETGWAGLLCLEDKELKDTEAHLTGYPGDKGLKTLWTMEDTISRVNTELLYYLMDTSGGQSGGAVWIKKWGMPHVLGTHTNGGTLEDGGNYGVRLSEGKIRDIAGWIRDTFTISSGAAAGVGVGAGTGLAVSEIPHAPIPSVAIGHEEIYNRFMKGSLIYRPTPGSDIGIREMRFSDIVNPETLEGTFDLSGCGAVGELLSINLGYRKWKVPANEGKLGIWITPKFAVEIELTRSAAYLAPIMGSWTGSLGLLWVWENWDSMKWYDYLVSRSFDTLNDNENLHEKWNKSTTTSWISRIRRPETFGGRRAHALRMSASFTFHF